MTHARPQALISLGAAAALALTLAACGNQDSGGDAEDRPTVWVTETATPGAEPPSDPESTDTDTTTPTETDPPVEDDPLADIDPELQEDITGAEQIVNQYWTDHWAEFFTGDYAPPTVIGLYDGNDPANAPTCFGDPLPADNAFYCPENDSVQWDISLLSRSEEIGDAWPYMIIAHEWGHAIQARLSMDLHAAKYEPQADCLAAAALYGAQRDKTLEFEPGDEKEIVEGLNFIGDESPWGMPGDHGDSFERIQWFNKGRKNGVAACLPGMVNQG